MEYWIDGYNLLFYLQETESKSFQESRENLLKFVHKNFSHKKIVLFFDAAFQEDELYHAINFQNFTIIYTPSKMSADNFILEKLSYEKYPKSITVVSSDNGLLSKVIDLDGKTKTLESFLKAPKQKKSKGDEKPSTQPDHELERLLKIFEDKFNNES